MALTTFLPRSARSSARRAAVLPGCRRSSFPARASKIRYSPHLRKGARGAPFFLCGCTCRRWFVDTGRSSVPRVGLGAPGTLLPMAYVPARVRSSSRGRPDRDRGTCRSPGASPLAKTSHRRSSSGCRAAHPASHGKDSSSPMESSPQPTSRHSASALSPVLASKGLEETTCSMG